MEDALPRMFDLIEQNVVFDQTMDVIFFLLQLVWLQEIFEYLFTKKVPVDYSEEQKKNLALKALHFSLVHGKLWVQSY